MSNDGLLGLGVLDVHVTVNGEDRNLSLSGLLQGVIPTGILGGGQDDGVDFVVNELVERLNLLLLIVVLGRRVGQVKAGILECLLNVLLVGGTEAASGPTATKPTVFLPESELPPALLEPHAATLTSAAAEATRAMAFFQFFINTPPRAVFIFWMIFHPVW